VCDGFVAIRIKSGTRTLSLRRSALDVECNYTSRVTLHSLSRLPARHGRLSVSVTFLGSKMLAPMRAPIHFVSFG
jgi:hypothetical protein